MLWLVLTAVYLWLGFTVGYFFRKWIGSRLEPLYRATLADKKAAAGRPAAGPGPAASPPPEDRSSQ